MTWTNRLEIELKEDAPLRTDDSAESQVSPMTQADVDADEASEAAATTDGMPPDPVAENDALGA